MINKMSHIGIAVRNLDESIKIYENLGLKLEMIEEVESQKVKVAFFPVGESRIELLSPTSEESPIAKFIEKKGEGIHHMALGVNDLPNELNKAENNGLQLIDKIPRIGAHRADIAFLHPKSTGRVLIELCKENH
ncbi:MAG: methylmalonyl-CoA epimerase [Candidatus Cloacimonadota bacterium]|nr:methylmalonyl-CoA epimerase [Candidatus Cloacimonadota bacterium]